MSCKKVKGSNQLKVSTLWSRRPWSSYAGGLSLRFHCYGQKWQRKTKKIQRRKKTS